MYDTKLGSIAKNADIDRSQTRRMGPMKCNAAN